MSIHQEKLRNAADICDNCFKIRLVERTEIRSTGLAATPESVYTRRERTTELDHHPSDEPTQDKHLFCECGVIGPNSRAWDDKDIDRERFKDLLKHSIRSAEHKGVTLSREGAVKRGLANLAVLTAWWRDDINSVDEALADALEYGSTAATVQTETPASAD